MAVLDIRKFSGLNTNADAATIDDSELINCVNLDVYDEGYLRKRAGSTNVAIGGWLSTQFPFLIGRFKTATNDHLITRAGGLWYSNIDGTGWTNPAGYSDMTWAAQYNDQLFVMRSGATSCTSFTAGYVATNHASINTGGTFNLFFKDRMWWINSTTTTGQNEHKLFYSDVNGAGTAPFGASAWPSTNWIGVNLGDGDWITALCVFNDALIIFKSRSIWILYVDGAPSNWVLKNLTYSLGALSAYTPKVIEGYLYFGSADGVFRTDGTTFEEISLPIRDKFVSRPVGRPTLTPGSVDFGIVWQSKYIYLAVEPTTPSNTRCWVFDYRNNSWVQYSFMPSGFYAASMLDLPDLSPSSLFIMSYGGPLTTHKLLRFGNPAQATDDGLAFSTTFTTKRFDFGNLFNWKRAPRMMYTLDTSAVRNLTTAYVTEKGQNAFATNTVANGGVTTPVTHPVKGPGYFKHLTISGTIVDTNTAWSLYGLSLDVRELDDITRPLPS